MNAIRHRGTLILLAVVIILFGGYLLFFRSSSSDSQSGTFLLEVEEEVSTSLIEQEILTSLRELQSISLDGSLLSSPFFRSLRDFSVELTPEPVGRSNPFIGVGLDAPLVIETDSSESENEETSDTQDEEAGEEELEF